MDREVKMTAEKRWMAVAAVLIVCALIAGAALPAAFGGASDTAYAAEAVTAGVYGEIDTDSLWYFGGSELNLGKLRSHVAVNILPVLRGSDVEPVVIAVVDTGLDTGNSLFAGDKDGNGELLLRDENGVLRGYNSYYASHGEMGKAGDFADESEGKHGTAVASIIAILIRETGLSDYIKIYPVKASYPTGSGNVNSFEKESIRLGIEHAVSDEVGAQVINLSLCSELKHETSWATDSAMKATVSEATRSATIVAAAGNEGKSSTSHYYYPAAYDNVLGVMAHDANGAYSTTNYGSAYDIFAPGSGILVSSSNGSYTTSGESTSGTSMSAPFVSFAAALLRLSFKAEQLAEGKEMPRTGAITRLMSAVSEEDATVTAKDGKEYKKLNILKLVSDDIENVDYGWLDPTGLTVSAKRAGKTVADEAAIKVQTLRETGEGRSLLQFTADISPADETDPSLADAVEWSLVEYGGEDGSEEVSVVSLGKGGSVEHLFDRAGSFGVRATLTVGEGASAVTFTDEFNIVASMQAWAGSKAHIVTEDYISSDAYIHGGSGKVPSSAILYGSGGTLTLTVTTIEDVAYDTVNWYVNGRIAGTGATFEFTPEGMPGKDYTVTARVLFEDGSAEYLDGFTVEHKSWAAHPLFAILWTALGVGAAVGVFFLVRGVKAKKAAKAASDAEEK